MDAVYEGYGALALASFNEKTALVDGTKRIKALEAALEKLLEQHDDDCLLCAQKDTIALEALPIEKANEIRVALGLEVK